MLLSSFLTLDGGSSCLVFCQCISDDVGDLLYDIVVYVVAEVPGVQIDTNVRFRLVTNERSKSLRILLELVLLHPVCIGVGPLLIKGFLAWHVLTISLILAIIFF